MTHETPHPSPEQTSAENNQTTTQTQTRSDTQQNPHQHLESHDDTLDQEHVLTPRTNLYASREGWTLVISLPDADQSQALLETEGTVLKLSIPHQQAGVYQRSIQFPRETTWGVINARWSGDLLYVDLSKATPIKQTIKIG